MNRKFKNNSMTNVQLKCECGEIRGIAKDISIAKGNRIVCMCDDCQMYAHFLGRSQDILDKNGGTDIFQLAPSQIVIESGHKNLSCVRLTPKGLMRWYAGCCNTPIGNTMASPKIPFIGLVHSFMDHKGQAKSRDEDLGPILVYSQVKFGRGELPKNPPFVKFLYLIVRWIWLMLIAFIKGQNRPTPFFDLSSKKPVIEPKVLSLSQLNELRSIVDIKES